MDIKVSVENRIKIIDTVFTNSAKEGFFQNLRSKVECSHPMVEVKNEKTDPANPAFDQLNGRLNDNRGHFGILVCRGVNDEAKVNARCKTFLPNNYILWLTDKDLFELLELSRDNQKDEIEDFMDKKLRDLTF